ncbi:MAG: hypothetical protein ACRDOH_19320 [Streptosporangiaceae bacterium]
MAVSPTAAAQLSERGCAVSPTARTSSGGTAPEARRFSSALPPGAPDALQHFGITWQLAAVLCGQRADERVGGNLAQV